MSDMDAPAIQSDESRKSELVERVVAEARKRVDAESADSLERFIRQYFALVSPVDIIYTEPETLVGGVTSLWEFGAERKPGTTKIRLYNPTRSEHGWALEHTVIEIVNDDMPFLVDSVTADLSQHQQNVHVIIHPVIAAVRDESGRRIEKAAAKPGGSREVAESCMHVEVDQETGAEDLEAIRERLARVLDDVRVSVEDWHLMRERLRNVLEEIDGVTPPIPEGDLEETREFLRWLDDMNFVFLGYRRYRFVSRDGNDFLEVEPETGLGILRRLRPESIRRSSAPFTPEFSRFARRKQLLVVAKANHRSTVHRPVHMDRISLRRFDDNGNVIGEHRFLGLYTSVAYSQSVRFIPLLRQKAQRTMERAGLGETSHAGKALAQILESFPRDELFQITEDELFRTSLGILQLQERARIALFTRRDVFERFVSCLVYVPRERYDSELLDKIRTILELSYAGSVAANYTQITDSPLARVNFIVTTTPGQIPDIDNKRVEALITEAARTWADHLREEIVRAKKEERGLDLFRKYRDAFPSAYRERFRAALAIHDIDLIERILQTGGLIVDLYEQANEDHGGRMELRCKLVHPGLPLALSDVVPRFENMGFRVEMSVPYEVRPAGVGEPVRIRDFGLIAPENAHFGLSEVKKKFEETFIQAWRGNAEDDGFHRLVVRAGLEWDEIVIVRAYCKFLRQTGITFSEAYMQQTLANYAEITRELIRLFRTLFDPSLTDGQRVEAQEIRNGIKQMFASVKNIDEDRILRRYLNLIDSTLRTNFYQRDEKGGRKAWVSFKFDSKRLKELPLPKPMFEIFVYSPRFEGVHLRGGRVARGGLRWSDRREDFRDEILGLVKAQQVKNAVIVPVGSKGGFVLKQAPHPSGREELLAEGVACYKNFLRGLLDLTDNLVDGKVVPPSNVVRRDEDDTYLVVAADKGTATFSDIANGISAEYGFWLGDAFASGGSAGYDHKKMGITAKGAWEAVKRHFRETGVDIQSQDFTVVGVGDMSGDVFGNGMLLSKHIKLLGAFNHLHIFIDPIPDPEASWNERKRLFDLPRSTWMDYDAKALSRGGRVYDRHEKSITVSPEAKERLGLASAILSPDELIIALLKLEVDLLWFGGIGTFVKATDERSAEVRDRANDAIRVNAGDVRARVVGEGANLGFTQKGRIEFALRRHARTDGGGRINTDAIDNSAGVDTSDHEVNIKIALGDAVRHGLLDLKQRDALLMEMTDEVARLVLRDNYQQTQAISVAEKQGAALLDQQARMIRALEKSGRLSRAIEFLPDDDVIAERAATGIGLTRPELAVLLAYSKIYVYEELLDSDLPDDPLLEEDLVIYFPSQLRTRYRDLIRAHRLRREIIATYVTNSMVNRVGPTFVFPMIEKTGRSVSDVARAYTISREAFGMRATWREIEALDNQVPADVQTAMLIDIGRLVERCTRWFLRNVRDHLDISKYEGLYRQPIASLEERLDSFLPPSLRDLGHAKTAEMERAAIPAHLARRMASLDVLGSFPDIVRIGGDLSENVEEVGRIYFKLGARFEFDRLRRLASGLAAETSWQRAALEGVVDDLFTYQSTLVRHVLTTAEKAARFDAVDLWLQSRTGLVMRTDQLLSDLFMAPSVDLPMLMVGTRQLRALIES